MYRLTLQCIVVRVVYKVEGNTVSFNQKMEYTTLGKIMFQQFTHFKIPWNNWNFNKCLSSICLLRVISQHSASHEYSYCWDFNSYFSRLYINVLFCSNGSLTARANDFRDVWEAFKYTCVFSSLYFSKTLKFNVLLLIWFSVIAGHWEVFM